MDVLTRLVGKKFPLKDFDGNIIGATTIKKVYSLADALGFALQLDEYEPILVLISYAMAEKIVDEDAYQNLSIIK